MPWRALMRQRGVWSEANVSTTGLSRNSPQESLPAAADFPVIASHGAALRTVAVLRSRHEPRPNPDAIGERPFEIQEISTFE